MEKYYNIHDVVNFKVVNNAGLLNKILPFWDIELRDFESRLYAEPDFTVHLGEFSSPNIDCLIMDDKFYMKEDYLYCSDSYKYAKWKLMMSGFEGGSTKVNVSANPFAWMIIPDLIVNPLIWFKLTEKGYAIVHGSGVVKDDRAYVFTGRGAAGKSTIALNLVERGFKLLGDHFVVLGNKAVLSFLPPLHIADFNLRPIVRRRMKARHKIFFRLDQLSKRVTGLQVGTKISPKTLLPDLTADKAKLHSVILLLPREKFKVEKIHKEELIAHIISNQKLESLPFIKYMMEYSYLFPQSNMANHWTRYEQNLSQALAGAAALYRVEVPLKYDNGTLESILQMVD
jgi:hypothetical protein